MPQRVVAADGVAVDLRRVKVEEDVRKNGRRTVAGRLVELVPEDGLPDLPFLELRDRRQLELRLGGVSAHGLSRLPADQTAR
jgi:hypothetical protein